MIRSASRFAWWLSRHAWLTTMALCLLVLALGLHGSDLAAQDYRVWAFRAHGFLLWDINWYGGNTDVGYSVLFPAVGSIAGASIAGAVGCVLCAVLFGRLVSAPTRAAALSRMWFAVFTFGELVIGQAPFACSAACGLAAVLAVTRHRRWLALIMAILTSLFSPLGAMFLLLAGIAWTSSAGWRRTLPLAGSLCGIAISFAAGDGGLFPFTRAGLAGQLTIVVMGLVLIPRTHHRAIRHGLVLYGIICVMFFVVPNPVGGNMVRLTGLFIGPVAAYVLLAARRGRVLLLVSGPLLAFQLLPVVTAAAWAADDPSSHEAYYAGILPFLEAHRTPLARVEIPFTHNHWEATYVAEQVDLARGWDRQVDLARNALLYSPMTTAQYLGWLDDNAVKYVALPDVPLDSGGSAEATILAHPPSWLRLVYTDRHWHVWQVDDPTPIAQGVGSLTELGPDHFTMTSPQSGGTLVRVRWSPYWNVDQGNACVGKSAGGWTIVEALTPGSVRVSAHLSLDSDDRCSSTQLANSGF